MDTSYDLNRSLNGPGLVTPLNASANASKYLEQLRESRTKLMTIAKSYQNQSRNAGGSGSGLGGPSRGAGFGAGSGLPFDIGEPSGRISVPALLIRQGEKIEAMKQQLFQAQSEEQKLAMRLRAAELENEKLGATLASNLKKYEEDMAASEAAQKAAAADNQEYLTTVLDDLAKARNREQVLAHSAEELNFELDEAKRKAVTETEDAIAAVRDDLVAEHAKAMARLQDDADNTRHSLEDKVKIGELEHTRLGQELSAAKRALASAQADHEQQRRVDEAAHQSTRDQLAQVQCRVLGCTFR